MKTRLVYISGGENAVPTDIKAALDEIRKNLGLSDDVVLFGIPVDDIEQKPTLQEHKILQFPKKSILNVIENASIEPQTESASEEPKYTPDYVEEIVSVEEPKEIEAAEIEEEFSYEPLVVNDVSSESSSITDILGKIPGMNDEITSVSHQNTPSLVKEFNEFLDKAPEENTVSVPKKAKPFARKKNIFTNVLGDLFSYAGGAANEDVQSFTLPDFIKRP
jgi:hypothetical protein